MTREELIEKIVLNHGWATGAHGHKDDVIYISSLPEIIDLIEAEYEARVVAAIEKLLLQYYGSTDMRYPLEDAIEAVKALRGER